MTGREATPKSPKPFQRAAEHAELKPCGNQFLQKHTAQLGKQCHRRRGRGRAGGSLESEHGAGEFIAGARRVVSFFFSFRSALTLCLPGPLFVGAELSIEILLQTEEFIKRKPRARWREPGHQSKYYSKQFSFTFLFSLTESRDEGAAALAEALEVNTASVRLGIA